MSNVTPPTRRIDADTDMRSQEEMDTRDRGVVLPLALVLSMVLALVALAAGGLVLTGLRTSRATDRHLQALTAAEGGARFGAKSLGDSRSCSGEVIVDAGFSVNDIRPQVSCAQIDGACAVRSIASAGGVTRVLDATVTSDGTIASWSVNNGAVDPLSGPTDCFAPPPPPAANPCTVVRVPQWVNSTSVSSTLTTPSISWGPNETVVVTITFENGSNQKVQEVEAPAGWVQAGRAVVDSNVGTEMWMRTFDAEGTGSFTFKLDPTKVDSWIMSTMVIGGTPTITRGSARTGDSNTMVANAITGDFHRVIGIFTLGKKQITFSNLSAGTILGSNAHNDKDLALAIVDIDLAAGVSTSLQSSVVGKWATQPIGFRC
jgi:Tfp pilus assembly protein PilX